MNGMIQEYGSFIVEVLCATGVVAIMALLMNGMSDLASHIATLLVGG